jgi:hypothetical protein
MVTAKIQELKPLQDPDANWRKRSKPYDKHFRAKLGVAIDLLIARSLSTA